MKRQPTEWGKVFANHISDKGIVLRIYWYKVCLQFNNNETTPFKNGQRIWTDTKEDIQVTK